MQDKGKNNTNNSLVPFNSKGLEQLNNSINLTEKLIKEYNERPILLTWKVLLMHSSFFNHFFSTFYEFNESQLNRYHKMLIIGRPSLFIGSDIGSLDTVFGLIFNTNIKWTENLKKLYYYEPSLIYAGDGRDVYEYELEFDKLPESIDEEIKGIELSAEGAIIDSYRDTENEEDYDNLGQELEHSISYYENIRTKENFTDSDILNIIEERNFCFWGNSKFRSTLINKLFRDISSFNVEDFYLKISENANRSSF